MGTGLRPYFKIDTEMQLAYEIINGLNPLEYVLENSKFKCGILFHNLPLLKIIEACFEKDEKYRTSADQLSICPFF